MLAQAELKHKSELKACEQTMAQKMIRTTEAQLAKQQEWHTWEVNALKRHHNAKLEEEEAKAYEEQRGSQRTREDRAKGMLVDLQKHLELEKKMLREEMHKEDQIRAAIYTQQVEKARKEEQAVRQMAAQEAQWHKTAQEHNEKAMQEMAEA
eukprot:5473066-Pyramimonas_sp.AAC.1